MLHWLIGKLHLNSQVSPEACAMKKDLGLNKVNHRLPVLVMMVILFLLGHIAMSYAADLQ